MNQIARFIKEVGDFIYARDRWQARDAQNAFVADIWQTGWRRLNENPLLAIPVALLLGGILYLFIKLARKTDMLDLDDE